MTICRVMSCDKSTVIGVSSGKEIALYSFDGNNMTLLSCFLAEFDVIDYVMIRSFSQNSFVLCAITKDIVLISVFNYFGEITRRITASHTVNNSNTLRIVYVSSVQRFFILNVQDASVLFSVEDIDSQISIQEMSFKLDTAKKYVPVSKNPLLLLHVFAASDTQAYLVLISQCIRTGSAVIQWCHIDISSDTMYPLWESHHPGSHTSFAVLPTHELVAIGLGRDIMFYGPHGLVGRLAPSRIEALNKPLSDCIAGLQFSPCAETARQIDLTISYASGHYVNCGVKLTSKSEGGLIAELQTSQLLRATGGASRCGALGRHCGRCDEVPSPSHFQPFLPCFHHFLTISRHGPEEDALFGLAYHNSFGCELITITRDSSDILATHLRDSLREKVSTCIDIGGLRNVSLAAVTRDEVDRIEHMVLCVNDETIYDSEVPNSLLVSCGVGVSLVADVSSPVEIPDMKTEGINIFSVICDVAVDAIPVTQRSHSSPWSSLLVMTSRKSRESSLITINHIGRIQLSIDTCDLTSKQETLGFFRIGADHVLQIVPSELVLLNLKTLRKPINTPRYDCIALHLPPDGVIEKCTQGAVYNADCVSGLGRACPYFAISSRNCVKIYCFGTTSNGPLIREIASKRLFSEVSAMSLTSLPASGQSEFIVAISTWDVNEVNVLHIKQSASNGGGVSSSYEIVKDLTLAITDTVLHRGRFQEGTNMRLMQCISNPTDLPGSTDIFVACASLSGSLVVLRLQHTTEQLIHDKNSDYFDEVPGGIIKVLCHPLENYFLGRQGACIVVNGGDSDFLYSFDTSRRWTRVALIRPSNLHKRMCLTPVHSHSTSLCSLNPTTGSAMSHTKKTPQDACLGLRGLKFAWIESTPSADMEDFLLLCVGSLSPSDHVLSTHIKARAGLACRVLEMITLAHGKLLLVLWTRNLNPCTQITDLARDLQPSGVTLFDALSLQTLWEYKGKRVSDQPVGLCECPVPPMGSRMQMVFQSCFAVVMGNDTALCFGVSQYCGGTNFANVQITNFVRFSVLSGVACFAMLGSCHMVCADNMYAAVYGWTDVDIQDSIEISIAEQSTIALGTNKGSIPTACVDIKCHEMDCRDGTIAMCVSLAYVGLELWSYHTSRKQWQRMAAISGPNFILDCLNLFFSHTHSVPFERIVCLDRLTNHVMVVRPGGECDRIEILQSLDDTLPGRGNWTTSTVFSVIQTQGNIIALDERGNLRSIVVPLT